MIDESDRAELVRLRAQVAELEAERDALVQRKQPGYVFVRQDVWHQLQGIAEAKETLLAALEKWKYLLERFYPLRDQPDLSVLDMFPGDKEKMLAAIAAAHQGEPETAIQDEWATGGDGPIQNPAAAHQGEDRT
jgi:hypothetical protein